MGGIDNSPHKLRLDAAPGAWYSHDMPTRRFALAIASTLIGHAALRRAAANTTPTRSFNCSNPDEFAALMTLLRNDPSI